MAVTILTSLSSVRPRTKLKTNPSKTPNCKTNAGLTTIIQTLSDACGKKSVGTLFGNKFQTFFRFSPELLQTYLEWAKRMFYKFLNLSWKTKKTSTFGPKSVPSQLQVGPKSAPGRPQVGPKSAPSQPQNGPKSAPKWPQVSPRSAPGRP